MELRDYLYNAISDYNDVAETDHGDRRYTERQVADMADYFAEFASMVE